MPIGLRLFLAFLVIILLTGIIGLFAVQQFSTLTATTTELNTHDLPEVITLGHIRTQLFQERDLARSLVSTDDRNEGSNLASLTSTLKQIAAQRAALLRFEPIDATASSPNDTPLIQQLSEGILRSSALSKQIQALVQNGQIEQAQVLEPQQLEPLLQETLAVTAQLRDLEQAEASQAAAQVQQESSEATLLVLLLTAFSVPLSFLLALIILRSLTRPLSVLLHATEAIASGDLDVNPHIKQRDELGRLATAFDIMRLNLRSTIATLDSERQQTQAIIDASADGVILVDAERTILQFNPTAERLSGWHSYEALGKPCWEVFGCRGSSPEEAEEHERLCPLKRALQTNSEQSYTEIYASLRNRQQRWFAVNCAPVPSHDEAADDEATKRRLVVGIHDISQLKAVEQLKSDFVAMVSHELRAPLTTVAGSVETLGILDPTDDNESYQEVVGILHQQTRRLRQVVEEVLQLTSFEAGRLQVHLKPLPIVQSLRTIIDSVRHEWADDERIIRLRIPQADPQIWADHDLLEIVIRNLLDNARKYTPSGSPIEVEVEAANAKGRVLVRIIDHGPGIPPEHLQHIFERFSRGTHASSHWTRGYGLGLYIARELLRVHNGDIWAENRQGGACFVLSLCAVEDDPNGNVENEEIGTTYEHDHSYD
ncbi:MAG: hypothetical protein NVSMB27_06420 [Ktedonobacteraceae bacterium]